MHQIKLHLWKSCRLHVDRSNRRRCRRARAHSLPINLMKMNKRFEYEVEKRARQFKLLKQTTLSLAVCIESQETGLGFTPIYPI